MADPFSVDEAVRWAGRNIQKIQYYERIRLILRALPTNGNHRLYEYVSVHRQIHETVLGTKASAVMLFWNAG